MAFAHEARILLPLIPERGVPASFYEGILLPEQFDGPEGTSFQLLVEEGHVVLLVQGATLSGLRAAINGLLGMVDVALRIAK